MPCVGLIAAQKASSSGVIILSAVKVPFSLFLFHAGRGGKERITYYRAEQKPEKILCFDNKRHIAIWTPNNHTKYRI